MMVGWSCWMEGIRRRRDAIRVVVGVGFGAVGMILIVVLLVVSVI